VAAVLVHWDAAIAVTRNKNTQIAAGMAHLVAEELQALCEHADAVLGRKHRGHQLLVAAYVVQHGVHAHEEVQVGPGGAEGRVLVWSKRL